MAGPNGINGHATQWGSYVSTGILLVAIAGGFWSLADPRVELRDLKVSALASENGIKANFNNYLSLREHEEFVRRFTADAARVEAINTEQSSILASKREVEALERSLGERLRLIQLQVDLLMSRSLILPPPNMSQPNVPR